MPYQQMQQQGQLFGAGQYGETMMSGLEARLVAEQAKANLLGGIGSGLLSGVFGANKDFDFFDMLENAVTGG